MKTFVIKSLSVLMLLTIGVSCNRSADELKPRSNQGSARLTGDTQGYTATHVPGNAPIAIFQAPCEFTDDMWERSTEDLDNLVEMFGVVTTDGYYLVTGQGSYSQGGSTGLIRNDAIQQAYYYYPVGSNPVPAFNYRIVRLTGVDYYATEIQATVHTHTPCIDDGTDGVSYPVSAGDQDLANKYKYTQHTVIGCDGVLADFDHHSTAFFEKRQCSSLLN